MSSKKKGKKKKKNVTKEEVYRLIIDIYSDKKKNVTKKDNSILMDNIQVFTIRDFFNLSLMEFADAETMFLDELDTIKLNIVNVLKGNTQVLKKNNDCSKEKFMRVSMGMIKVYTIHTEIYKMMIDLLNDYIRLSDISWKYMVAKESCIALLKNNDSYWDEETSAFMFMMIMNEGLDDEDVKECMKIYGFDKKYNDLSSISFNLTEMRPAMDYKKEDFDKLTDDMRKLKIKMYDLDEVLSEESQSGNLKEGGYKSAIENFTRRYNGFTKLIIRTSEDTEFNMLPLRDLPTKSSSVILTHLCCLKAGTKADDPDGFEEAMNEGRAYLVNRELV